MNHAAEDRAGAANAVIDIDALLLRHGQDFAACACAAFLGRPARPAEVEEIAARLELGDSKMRILSELCGSPEGRRGAIVSRGFGVVALRFRLARLSVAGRLLDCFLRADGDSVLARRSRALESRMIKQARQISVRLDRVREGIAAVARAGAERLRGDGQALEKQRALLRAEHAIDRKVWAIEQAEGQKYIASILAWAKKSEEYAKSLEKEVERLRGVFDTEAGNWESARADALRRIAELERQVAVQQDPRS